MLSLKVQNNVGVLWAVVPAWGTVESMIGPRPDCEWVRNSQALQLKRMAPPTRPCTGDGVLVEYTCREVYEHCR